MNKEENVQYLAFIASPVSFAVEPYLVGLGNNGEPFTTDLEFLSTLKIPVVTYSFWLLVEWFREKNLQLPTQVIDLKAAMKLLIGRPKSDFSQSKPWGVWELVKEFYTDEPDEKFERLKNTLALQLTVPDIEDPSVDLEKLVKVLPKVWEKLKLKLSSSGEYQRFFNIELPSYQIFLERQFHGICVNKKRVEERLKLADRLFYKSSRKLTVDYEIDYKSLLSDKQKLFDLLEKEGLAELKYWVSRDNVEECLDFASLTSDICKLLYDTLSARREKSVLLKFVATYSGKIFPVFDSLGTVSGRVLVVDPHIQYLKKTSRDIICADSDKDLMYIDYDHFEPGIMASLSEDPHLINIYNKGDIYLYLSNSLFGDKKHRKFCKKLFLAYSYGMSKKGMELLLQKETTEAQKLADNFYDEFRSIENWKVTIWQKLLSDGKIGTVCGNYRYRTKEGTLENKEKRWAISQLIQGTGAYILKQVILTLSDEVPKAEILVPMYDAILFQIPKGHNDSLINEIKNVFIKTFKTVCPQIFPRVSIENFFQAE